MRFTDTEFFSSSRISRQHCFTVSGWSHNDFVPPRKATRIHCGDTENISPTRTLGSVDPLTTFLMEHAVQECCCFRTKTHCECQECCAFQLKFTSVQQHKAVHFLNCSVVTSPDLSFQHKRTNSSNPGQSSPFSPPLPPGRCAWRPPTLPSSTVRHPVGLTCAPPRGMGSQILQSCQSGFGEKECSCPSSAFKGRFSLTVPTSVMLVYNGTAQDPRFERMN